MKNAAYKKCLDLDIQIGDILNIKGKNHQEILVRLSEAEALIEEMRKRANESGMRSWVLMSDDYSKEIYETLKQLRRTRGYPIAVKQIQDSS